LLCKNVLTPSFPHLSHYLLTASSLLHSLGTSGPETLSVGLRTRKDR
jgi:hypothetical protein